MLPRLPFSPMSPRVTPLLLIADFRRFFDLLPLPFSPGAGERLIDVTMLHSFRRRSMPCYVAMFADAMPHQLFQRDADTPYAGITKRADAVTLPRRHARRARSARHDAMMLIHAVDAITPLPLLRFDASHAASFRCRHDTIDATPWLMPRFSPCRYAIRRYAVMLTPCCRYATCLFRHFFLSAP